MISQFRNLGSSSDIRYTLSWTQDRLGISEHSHCVKYLLLVGNPYFKAYGVDAKVVSYKDVGNLVASLNCRLAKRAILFVVMFVPSRSFTSKCFIMRSHAWCDRCQWNDFSKVIMMQCRQAYWHKCGPRNNFYFHRLLEYDRHKLIWVPFLKCTLKSFSPLWKKSI